MAGAQTFRTARSFEARYVAQGRRRSANIRRRTTTGGRPSSPSWCWDSAPMRWSAFWRSPRRSR